MNYVDKLQKEQLSYTEERKEINELREKVQQLQLKVVEGQSKDDLIVSLKTHIKDLQTTLSDLMHNVNNELVELKTFIKENTPIKSKEKNLKSLIYQLVALLSVNQTLFTMLNYPIPNLSSSV